MTDVNSYAMQMAARVLSYDISAFGEQTTVEFTPLIELDSSNGLSALRDVQTTANNGTISASDGEYELATSTTANGSAILETAERGRYQPGIEGLAGVAIRRPSAPTGNQYWQAGYYDANNGIMVGEDATGPYIRLRTGGTDRDKVRPSNWRDPVNGSGSSGLTWDRSKMTILRFPIVWYGGGPLGVDAVLPSKTGEAKLVKLYRAAPVSDEPIIEEPKLPVRAEVDNGGDASDYKIFVGGRHFAVRGRYNPNRRETAEYRLSVSTSTTVIPLVSFRKKTDSVSQPKSIKISGLNVLTDVDSLVEIHLEPTLTGASFGSVTGIPDSETAVQADTSATAITSGQVIDRTMASGGQGNRSNLAGIRRLGLDIPDDTIVTLAIRTVTGTGTASAVFTIEEEW